MLAAIIIAVWMVLWKFFEGENTLALPGREHTDLHEHLTSFRDSVLASRDTNPIIQATYADRRRGPRAPSSGSRG